MYMGSVERSGLEMRHQRRVIEGGNVKDATSAAWEDELLTLSLEIKLGFFFVGASQTGSCRALDEQWRAYSWMSLERALPSSEV